MKLTVAPLTEERWADLETLFAGKGCSFARACWCMECRYDGTRPELGKGAVRAKANRTAMEDFVKTGGIPGLIGYNGRSTAAPASG